MPGFGDSCLLDAVVSLLLLGEKHKVACLYDKRICCFCGSETLPLVMAFESESMEVAIKYLALTSAKDVFHIGNIDIW